MEILQVYKDIKIDQITGLIMLSLVDSNGQLITGQISLEQLIKVNCEVERILDPQKGVKERLKDLKRFKREAYSHFLREQDPELKEQRLKFYIETKRLVVELEEGIGNDS